MTDSRNGYEISSEKERIKKDMQKMEKSIQKKKSIGKNRDGLIKSVHGSRRYYDTGFMY